MRIAYLILAHRNPKQIKELIIQLKSKDSSFFIHIDSKSNIDNFKSETREIDAEIKYSENRKNGQWGDIGIVNATIQLLQDAIREFEFDYYVLLSGMDFPIKSNKDILQFLTINNGKSFISYSKLPVSDLNYGGLDRIYGYSYTIKGRRYSFVPFNLNPTFNFRGHVLNLILGAYSLFKGRRKKPEYIEHFYYGSQWWMLHKSAIKVIFNFLDRHPDYLKFHKYTLLPDELFFQTVLLNSPERQMLQITNDNFRYIVWEKNTDHPKTIGIEDLNSLLASPALFARKFELDAPVLQQIKTVI